MMIFGSIVVVMIHSEEFLYMWWTNHRNLNRFWFPEPCVPSIWYFSYSLFWLKRMPVNIRLNDINYFEWNSHIAVLINFLFYGCSESDIFPTLWKISTPTTSILFKQINKLVFRSTKTKQETKSATLEKFFFKRKIQILVLFPDEKLI